MTIKTTSSSEATTTEFVSPTIIELGFVSNYSSVTFNLETGEALASVVSLNVHESAYTTAIADEEVDDTDDIFDEPDTMRLIGEARADIRAGRGIPGEALHKKP